MTGEQTLAQLRAGIDECDSQLVQLLAKRNALTSQIGAIKQEIGAPLHAPDRESLLIEARRQQAEQHNVNPDLVEDMLRRMMREAYENQQSKLACKAPELSPVVIVGGEGAMGQLFAKQLTRSGYEIRILDRAQQADAETILTGAKLVLVSVPINALEEVAGKAVRQRVVFEHDARIASIMANWPQAAAPAWPPRCWGCSPMPTLPR